MKEIAMIGTLGNDNDKLVDYLGEVQVQPRWGWRLLDGADI